LELDGNIKGGDIKVRVELAQPIEKCNPGLPLAEIIVGTFPMPLS
jgi:hypothetical protein